jgi:hypothetical protein
MPAEIAGAGQPFDGESPLLEANFGMAERKMLVPGHAPTLGLTAQHKGLTHAQRAAANLLRPASLGNQLGHDRGPERRILPPRSMRFAADAMQGSR